MRKIMKYIDKPLLFVTIILFIFGLVMVFSASNVTAYMSHAISPYYYFIKQAIFLAVGLILSYIMVKFNVRSYGMFSKFLMLASIISLVGLLLLGTAINKSLSWFDLGFFSIQPSEFVKVITIVYLAEYYDRNSKKLDSWTRVLFPLIFCAIIVVLIFFQPDLGTAIIYSLIVISIYFAVPIAKEIKLKTFIIGVGVIFLGVFILIGSGSSLIKDRQKERFDFLRPCDRILDNGSQVCNCYIAIKNGGLTGVGLGNSTQKYLYLPEPYTDFIFAIIVEELGVITGVILIILYFFVLYRILLIGRRSPNNRGATLCYGIAVYIFLHVVVNLLGIMGLMPLTGVPLPFMSYGGSFTICLIAALTIVQRVSYENGILKEKSRENA